MQKIGSAKHVPKPNVYKSNKRTLAWSVREVMLWRRLSGGYWSLWRAAILQGDRPSRRNSCALTLHNELSKTADVCRLSADL